jgi:hypothetical protein
MTDPDLKHAAFRLEHTVRWNPHVPLVRTIRVDPPVTLDDARQMVSDNLGSMTGHDVWSLMDGAQLIRSADIVAIKVVPVGSAPADHGEGFGLTVVG